MPEETEQDVQAAEIERLTSELASAQALTAEQTETLRDAERELHSRAEQISKQSDELEKLADADAHAKAAEERVRILEDKNRHLSEQLIQLKDRNDALLQKTNLLDHLVELGVVKGV